MPLYEYRCTSCGYKFEKIQKFSDEPESVCPKCQGELVRPMTAPALKFEGAGWYINDYSAKGGASKGDGAPAADGGGETKSESKPAETSAASSSAASTSAASPAAPASGSAGSGSSGSGSSTATS